MTRDEFIEFHGEAAWKNLVQPTQDDPGVDPVVRTNANAIWDDRIRRVLRAVGGGCQTIREVQQLLVAAQSR